MSTATQAGVATQMQKQQEMAMRLQAAQIAANADMARAGAAIEASRQDSYDQASRNETQAGIAGARIQADQDQAVFSGYSQAARDVRLAGLENAQMRQRFEFQGRLQEQSDLRQQESSRQDMMIRSGVPLTFEEQRELQQLERNMGVIGSDLARGEIIPHEAAEMRQRIEPRLQYLTMRQGAATEKQRAEADRNRVREWQTTNWQMPDTSSPRIMDPISGRPVLIQDGPFAGMERRENEIMVRLDNHGNPVRMPGQPNEVTPGQANVINRNARQDVQRDLHQMAQQLATARRSDTNAMPVLPMWLEQRLRHTLTGAPLPTDRQGLDDLLRERLQRLEADEIADRIDQGYLDHGGTPPSERIRQREVNRAASAAAAQQLGAMAGMAEQFIPRPEGWQRPAQQQPAEAQPGEGPRADRPQPFNVTRPETMNPQQRTQVEVIRTLAARFNQAVQPNPQAPMDATMEDLAIGQRLINAQGILARRGSVEAMTEAERRAYDTALLQATDFIRRREARRQQPAAQPPPVRQALPSVSGIR